ncbi:MAG TPA: endonuclease V [bacterium]|nr:endonuclease V [bacterium]
MAELLHPEIRWPKTPAEALEQQRRLVKLLPPERPLGPVALVGGLDVSYSRRLGRVFAVLTVARPGGGEEVERAFGEAAADFPYVPGLLSYREGPACVDAWRKLENVPDVLLCDGQGRAHPRRLGLASHLGLLFDVPTVGVAKSRLTGKHGPVGREKGATTPLVDAKTGETIGTVLRSRTDVRPLYVSVGAGLTLVDAVRIALSELGRYRLPEPARRAHNLVTLYRKDAEGR